MNIHTVIDDFTAFTGVLAAGDKKFFSESIESQGFSDYLGDISFALPEIPGEGKYSIDIASPHAHLDPAFWVYKYAGPEAPTILFHHGNNEDPFDEGMFAKHSFKIIFRSNNDIPDVNIVAIRAPFHGGSLKEYTAKIAHLSNFVEMLSASVVLVEKLTKYFQKDSDQPVLVSGISLGGWVTNLHRAYFNSADKCVPLLAGASLAEVFLTSKYQKLTGDLARNNPEVIRGTLNFEEDFARVSDDNLFPLLGRYDQFIQYEVQKPCYSDHYPLNVLDKGHVTSLLAAKKLYAHITGNLNQ